MGIIYLKWETREGRGWDLRIVSTVSLWLRDCVSRRDPETEVGEGADRGDVELRAELAAAALGVGNLS